MDMDMVTDISVIKRKLHQFNIKTVILCHSGLLLKTSKNKYFIIEYGSGKDYTDNDVVKLREIKSMQVKKYSVLEEDYIWDRTSDTKLRTPMDLMKIHKIMEDKMLKTKYNVYYWNCHMAQERLRQELGLSVPFKYEFALILFLLYVFSFVIITIINISDNLCNAF
jgi:hypothetical protein